MSPVQAVCVHPSSSHWYQCAGRASQCDHPLHYLPLLILILSTILLPGPLSHAPLLALRMCKPSGVLFHIWYNFFCSKDTICRTVTSVLKKFCISYTNEYFPVWTIWKIYVERLIQTYLSMAQGACIYCKQVSSVICQQINPCFIYLHLLCACNKIYTKVCLICYALQFLPNMQRCKNLKSAYYTYCGLLQSYTALCYY